MLIKLKKHNKRLREELADNMIDAVSKVDGPRLVRG